MKHFGKITAGFLLSTALSTSVFADEITMWTMEEQPDRLEAQERIASAFNAATGHTVKIVPVTEKDIATRATAAFAAGDLPDILNHTVQHLLPFASAGMLDTAAASDVVANLGEGSFAAGPLGMASVDGEVVSVPTDGWTQLVVYRKDLFEQMGLAAPTSFDAVQAAMVPCSEAVGCCVGWLRRVHNL